MPRIIQTNPDGSPIGNFLNQSRKFRNVNPVQPNSIVNVGQNKFFVYSGSVQGDVTIPASITLISIDDIGSQDSEIHIQPIFGTLVSSAVNSSLGIEVRINDTIVLTCDQFSVTNWGGTQLSTNQLLRYDLFVPRQSKLEVISLNTTTNNTQDRGCNILGEYI